MGYRISILPAEAFFANAVLLVEGPSEMLLYSTLAEKKGVDLDRYNISILSVDGVQFEVYTKILDAMEIPWAMRTDNDVSKVKGNPGIKRCAGVNRCLKVAESLSTELLTGFIKIQMQQRIPLFRTVRGKKSLIWSTPKVFSWQKLI